MSGSDYHEPYVYKPLPTGDYFRYLKLEPGSGDEPLRCSLCTHRICEATYEALSYVWGSDLRNRHIYCDGYTLNITSNLCDALRRLRSPTHIRELWADSICINQEDDEEKGHQVSIMGQIYSSASCVLISMGLDPDGHGSRVASLLDELQDLFEREMKGLVSFEWNSFPLLDTGTFKALMADTRWRSFRVLLHQPWFERGWVVREAGLAKHSQVTWGDGEFGWTALMWTVFWIKARTSLPHGLSESDLVRLTIHTTTYWDRHHRQLRIFYPSQHWVPSRLLHYLADGRRLRFKDRRDSIYAFLDLTVKPLLGLTLTTDYAMPVQEVFRSFAEEYIRVTGDITILTYVIHSTDSLQADLASWVPRWIETEQRDDGEQWRIMSLHVQNDAMYPQPEVVDGRLLKVQGTILDTVVFVSDVLYQSTSSPQQVYELWQNIQTWTSHAQHDFQYGLKDIVDVILYDRAEIRDEREWEQWKSEYTEELKRMERVAQDYCSEVFAYIQIWIARYSNAKALMATRRGYLGLAPAIAQEGDIIARLYGSTSLPEKYVYLLRATDKANHYKFVGPAWTYKAIPEETERAKNRDDAAEQSESKDQEDCEEDHTTGLQDIYLC